MRRLDSITDSMDMNVSKLQEIAEDSLACWSPWGCRESHMAYSLNNNTNSYS